MRIFYILLEAVLLVDRTSQPAKRLTRCQRGALISRESHGLIGMEGYLKRLSRKCRTYRHSKCDTERADQRQAFHNARILGPISRTCNGPLHAILRGCRRAVRSRADWQGHSPVLYPRSNAWVLNRTPEKV